VDDVSIPVGANRVVHSAEQAWLSMDAALITEAISVHLAHARAAAASGAHLFIEKPLANTPDGLPELLADCRANGLALLVAYNFRFYQPLQLMRDAVQSGCIGRVVSARAEVGQYLPDWRPGADYRQSVTARAELGGGVLLELSHEIDYLRWLVGESWRWCSHGTPGRTRDRRRRCGRTAHRFSARQRASDMVRARVAACKLIGKRR
jgi:predicted dehydrogenase